MSNFNSNLKNIRVKRGYTQARMANYLGITTQSYIQYENGKSHAAERISELAAILGVSTDELLSDSLPGDLSSLEENCVNVEANNLNLDITIETDDPEILGRWVQKVREIQKEHSCNCTLNVIPSKELNINTKEFAHRYYQAMKDNHSRRDRLKDLTK